EGVAALRAVAVRRREPEVVMLTRPMLDPAGKAQREALHLRRLGRDLCDRRDLPLQRVHLVAAVALLFPRIAPDVIAVRLPEPGTIAIDDAQRPEPLRALPEIEMRHDEPRRTAVIWRQRLAVVLVGDERLSVHRVGEQEIRGVAAVALGDESERVRCEFDVLEERVDAHAAPPRVELR